MSFFPFPIFHMPPKKNSTSGNFVPIDSDGEPDGDLITESFPQPRFSVEDKIILTHYESLSNGRLALRSEILQVEGLGSNLDFPPQNNSISNDSITGMDNDVDTWTEDDGTQAVIQLEKPNKKKRVVSDRYINVVLIFTFNSVFFFSGRTSQGMG